MKKKELKWEVLGLGTGSVVAAPVSEPHRDQFEGPFPCLPFWEPIWEKSERPFWRWGRDPRWGVEMSGGSYMLGSPLLQDNQDTLLEVQRSQALDKAAVNIQRVLRGYKWRCWPCPSPSQPTYHIYSRAYLPYVYILFSETSGLVVCPVSDWILC